MRQIDNDGDLRDLHLIGVGLIYNDFVGKGRAGGQFNILHAADCHWLTRSDTKCRKFYFENADEAVGWLVANRGEERVSWKRCGTCKADASSSLPTTNEPVVIPVMQHFTESAVEKILVQHLKQLGYHVRRRVRVPSGIIDVVADRPGERLVVEVKGEDRGGYGSADLNFGYAIGQIVSRMTEADPVYAVAVPWTPDYSRVLRKYHGTMGFERLGLRFYLVHSDGAVDAHSAQSLAALIASL